MEEIIIWICLTIIGGLIYNVFMVIILAAGLLAASTKKRYTGYFIAGAIVQVAATFGNFEPIISGKADYMQLGCNLVWSVILFLFFLQKARKLYSRDK